jgi:hypothetical protein
MSVPSEARAVEIMKKIQALSGQELDALIDAEIGNPMLGVFHALASAMFPGEPQNAAKRVHLMVLAYLMRVEAERRS